MDSFEFVPTLEHEANISFGSEAPATSLWETPLSILEEKMMAFADAVAELSDSSDAEIISRLHQERLRIIQALRPMSKTPPTVRAESERYFDAMSAVFWSDHADTVALHL